MFSHEIVNTSKRLYTISNYSKALEYLVKTCNLISAEKDGICDELFETYFYYVRCLYILSEFSSKCIGDGVKDITPEEERTPFQLIEEDDEKRLHIKKLNSSITYVKLNSVKERFKQ